MRCLLLLMASLVAGAQPKVGLVEIYGARQIAPDKIRKVLKVAPGDALPKSRGDVEEALEAIDGVVRARVEAFCCDAAGPVLYVGIQERGGAVFNTLPYPKDETLVLPEAVLAAYADFSAALSRASAAGDLAEDLSKGHSMMKNLPARLAQERFSGLAQLHTEELRNVLNNSADPELRAIAAYVLGYAPDKGEQLEPLMKALQDPDGAVRVNAARALRAFYAAGMKVPPTWFVEMLNSIELADRIEAVRVLLMMVEQKDAQATAAVRERALPALYEMARWQHLRHALPAYLLAGRVMGLGEEELEKAWSAGERETVIARLERPKKEKSQR